MINFIHDSKNQIKSPKWLVFFYSMPTKPVSKRMKIWRRLIKAGALHFRGSVYILPFNDDNLEFCQWLIAEIKGMGGEGAFIRTMNIETIDNAEIIELFNQQRDKDYRLIEKKVSEIEQKIQSIKAGIGNQDEKILFNSLSKLIKEFEETRKTDYFNAESGSFLSIRIELAAAKMQGIKGYEAKKEMPANIIVRSIDEYQGRTWATRKKPFVDRMASAWLIKKFIDKNAVFEFIDEQDMNRLDGGFIAFDMHGGAFTHIGNMCTFEVLLKTFGIIDKAAQKIAEIVHELDIKDRQYKISEAKGVEHILIGIRMTAQNDFEALEKGMAVFDMLYAAKS